MAIREIDTEHNPFWREGHRDAMDGRVAEVPDEARYPWQWVDYFAGYDAGQETRTALLIEEGVA